MCTIDAIRPLRGKGKKDGSPYEVQARGLVGGVN